MHSWHISLRSVGMLSSCFVPSLSSGFFSCFSNKILYMMPPYLSDMYSHAHHSILNINILPYPMMYTQYLNYTEIYRISLLRTLFFQASNFFVTLVHQLILLFVCWFIMLCQWHRLHSTKWGMEGVQWSQPIFPSTTPTLPLGTDKVYKATLGGGSFSSHLG